MASEIYLPLLSALVGALIGTAGTVAAVFIQARKEDRRHRREVAFKIATDQQAKHLELAAKQGGGTVQPVDIYLVHAFLLMKALESGTLNAEKLKSNNAELRALAAALNSVADSE